MPNRLLAKALSRPWFGATDFLVFFGFIGLCSAQLSSFFDDPGFGWHLRTGELIWRSGQVPMTDPFLALPTGTLSERPWVSDQWLSDLFFHCVGLTGGWALHCAVAITVFLILYFWVLLPALTSFSGSALAAMLAVVFPFKLAQTHFLLRATFFGFLFFGVLYCRLLVVNQAFKNGDNWRKELKWNFLFLPVLFTVWANFHPSFFLGFILLGITCVAPLFDRFVLGLKSDPRESRDFLVHNALLACVCLLVTFINPNFSALHQSILSLGQSEFFMRFHMEWLSPDFRKLEGKLFEFLLVALAVAPFLTRKVFSLWRSFEILSLLIFAHLGLQAVRIIPYFAIIAALPLAQVIVGLAESPIFSSPRGKWLLARLSAIEAREKKTGKGLAVILACVVATFGLALSRGEIPFNYEPFGPREDRYPYRALEVVAKREVSTPSVVVASTPAWGGFLTWYSNGRIKPIIDDRNTLLGEEFYKEYFAKFKPGEQFLPYLRSFSTKYVLLGAKSDLTTYIKDTALLDLVYQDSNSVLFEVK